MNREVPQENLNELLLEIEANQEKLRTWAQYASMNCLHKFDLVEAERHRMLGEKAMAIEAYDRAIAGAKENGYLRETALANELAAQFYLDWGKEKVARVYLQDARDGYQRWGASAKVKQLEQRYARWLAPLDSPTHPTDLAAADSASLGATDRASGVSLDLLTVIKASQALAGEIELERLLRRMMRIVLENAGAQRGALLLEQGGAWVIEAQGDVGSEDIAVLQARDPKTNAAVSSAIVAHVARTRASVILDDAARSEEFGQDPYIVQERIKSVIGLPLVNQGRLSGILYLENNLATHAFTAERLELLKLLSTQMALSLDNAKLYRNLEAKVVERTHRLAEARDAADAANRAKSIFLANMSHELRTPLNSTLILAKLLADNKPGNLSGDQVKYASTIYAAGNDLLALINDILDLSKIEAGQATLSLEPVRLSRVLQSLTDPLRPLAQEKGLTLAATIAPDAPATMTTDPLRLGQVLKNLLSNALKFTEKGGVTLHVAASAGDTLSFVVTDTGIGIARDQQELVFEAFRQADGSTHRKYGGTGLGLSISRDLAHLLGGTLSVRSTPGEGSVFTLVLPVHLQPQDEVTPPHRNAPDAYTQRPFATDNALGVAPSSPASMPSGKDAGAPAALAVPAPVRAGARSILVVEDDERFAHILRELAQEMGFECHLAHNAADGLAMAAQLLPSAIVLDVNLPDFSGLGVLDQLKRNPDTRHIPVHVVSVADYSQEAMGRGAVGYALKPVQRDELVHALQRLEAKFTQNMRRVLVVEDDERQRESVRHLLSRDDVEIVCAGTAALALDHLRGATFDCMVMDLNLPDMNGYELLQQMTDQDGVSFPPVIVYTGRTLSRDEEMRLRRFSKSIIIKDARSPERLLDEVTLFLHQVESELSEEHRQMLQVARSRDTALEGRTVLVVEDDVRNVFALSSILEPTGIRIEIARNGIEALQALDRRSKVQAVSANAPTVPAIDLVLMDIMMPEMDGYTAMREIRNRPEWRRLPIIALTAKAMKDDQEKCLAAGANDYISKPLDVEKLLSLVRVWMPK